MATQDEGNALAPSTGFFNNLLKGGMIPKQRGVVLKSLHKQISSPGNDLRRGRIYAPRARRQKRAKFLLPGRAAYMRPLQNI